MDDLLDESFRKGAGRPAVDGRDRGGANEVIGCGDGIGQKGEGGRVSE